MLSETLHRRIFLFGLICLSSGLLFGAVFMSVSQSILVANWLIEKKFNNKLFLLYKNKYFWLLSSLILLHLIGLFYTTDISSGLNDIKTKVPLLVIAILFFSSKPLIKKELELILKLFTVSVITSSLYCFIVYLGYTNKTIIDVRDASVFMSHIRFSLIITFTIFILLFLIKSKQNIIIGCIGIIWLLFFMYKFQMATGLTILISTTFVLTVAFIIKKRNVIFTSLCTLIIIVCAYFGYHKIKSELLIYNKNNYLSSNLLLSKTVNNNNYLQDTLFNLAENGTLITINISDIELENEWNKRSKLNFKDNDLNGNNLRFTILRYMASKGLTKDSIGLSALTKNDFLNIESGIPNYKYSLNSGLVLKWRELIWEYTKYKRNENPSGHTLTMRLEFWKTALYIINQNPIFGVGTGDIQQAFNKAYDETNSKLSKEWRLRCHNQYLAITVAFGFVGLILFLIYFLFPITTLSNKLHELYWPFVLIILFSFITEDTLENQAGLTFFAIFQTLFIWLASSKETETNR